MLFLKMMLRLALAQQIDNATMGSTLVRRGTKLITLYTLVTMWKSVKIAS